MNKQCFFSQLTAIWALEGAQKYVQILYPTSPYSYVLPPEAVGSIREQKAGWQMCEAP